MLLKYVLGVNKRFRTRLVVESYPVWEYVKRFSTTIVRATERWFLHEQFVEQNAR